MDHIIFCTARFCPFRSISIVLGCTRTRKRWGKLYRKHSKLASSNERNSSSHPSYGTRFTRRMRCGAFGIVSALCGGKICCNVPEPKVCQIDFSVQMCNLWQLVSPAVISIRRCGFGRRATPFVYQAGCRSLVSFNFAAA